MAQDKGQRTKEMAQGTHLRFSSYGGQAGHRVKSVEKHQVFSKL